MTTKKGLICLSIAAIVVLCTLNIATASTSNHSTTFYNNARHIDDQIPKAKGSTSNVVSNRNCVTKGIFTSSATSNGVVYIGSQDGNVYALNANTGTKMWSYTTRDWVLSSPTIVNGIG